MLSFRLETHKPQQLLGPPRSFRLDGTRIFNLPLFAAKNFPDPCHGPNLSASIVLQPISSYMASFQSAPPQNPPPPPPKAALFKAPSKAPALAPAKDRPPVRNNRPRSADELTPEDVPAPASNRGRSPPNVKYAKPTLLLGSDPLTFFHTYFPPALIGA